MTTTGFGKAGVIAVVASAVFLLALVVVLLLRWKNKKKQEREASIENGVEEMNQVYGMYYFFGGGRIDDRRAEVTDSNDYCTFHI